MEQVYICRKIEPEAQPQPKRRKGVRQRPFRAIKENPMQTVLRSFSHFFTWGPDLPHDSWTPR